VEELAMIPAMKSRNEIPALLNSMGLLGVGVEIGVGVGGFSSYLLHRTGLARLYSVDPWSNDQPGLPDGMTDQECFLSCVQELWKYYPRSVLLRMTSADASTLFPSESLDFVYIDGNHEFWAVVNDLHAWWPKVRPGGILSGHDYREDIALAVDQFCKCHSVEPVLTECDEMHPSLGAIRSWITQKPAAGYRFVSMNGNDRQPVFVETLADSS
jgi:hypothetical protein